MQLGNRIGTTCGAACALLLAWLAPHAAAAQDAVVTSQRFLGPLIEATVAIDGGARRLLFPAGSPCAELLRPESRVTWQDRGPFGRVAGSAGECVATGTADLEGRRDSRPRDGRRPLERKTARFEEQGRDDAWVLVRGRFPLAARVGFGGAFDLYALIPNTPACAAALAEGEAFMEFRQAGRDPFRLGSDPECVIQGFAIPGGS